MSSLLLAIVLALHALVLAGNAQPPEPSCAPERWPHAQYAPITRDTLDQLEPVVSFECDTPVELVWSPDGRYLAISTPQAIWVHDLSSERAPLVLPPTADGPFERSGALAFSPDSTTLALVDPVNGALQLWSLADAHLIRTTPARAEIDDLERYTGLAAISPDLSQWALAYLHSRSIYLLDTTSGEPLAVLRGHIRVGALAYSPDGTRLISGGRNGGTSHDPNDTTVRVWDTQTGAMLAAFDVNSPLNFLVNPPQHIAFSSDGDVAAFSLFSGVFQDLAPVALLDLTTLNLSTIPVGDHYVKLVTFRPNGEFLAISTINQRYQQSVTFLDYDSRQVVGEIAFDKDFILGISFNPAATLMLVAAYDETITNRIEVWAVAE